MYSRPLSQWSQALNPGCLHWACVFYRPCSVSGDTRLGELSFHPCPTPLSGWAISCVLHLLCVCLHCDKLWTVGMLPPHPPGPSQHLTCSIGSVNLMNECICREGCQGRAHGLKPYGRSFSHFQMMLPLSLLQMLLTSLPSSALSPDLSAGGQS